jgi:hypothetical protein
VSLQVENFSVQVGNQTHTDDESNPVEINVSSAMKGAPGLDIGLTVWDCYTLLFLHDSPSPIVKRGFNRGAKASSALPRE